MIDWIKSKIVTIGMAIGAVLLVLSAVKASKRKKSAKRKEALADDLVSSMTFKDHKKAQKLIKSAQKDKQAAKISKEEMEYKLEKLSEQNTDIDALADAFNSRRVRKSATS